MARDLNIVSAVNEKLNIENNLKLADLELLTERLNRLLQNASLSIKKDCCIEFKTG